MAPTPLARAAASVGRRAREPGEPRGVAAREAAQKCNRRQGPLAIRARPSCGSVVRPRGSNMDITRWGRVGVLQAILLYGCVEPASAPGPDAALAAPAPSQFAVVG